MRGRPPPFPSDTDDAYEVVDQAVGPDAASPLAFAWAGDFEGLNEAQMAGHDRAGRERIKPLVEQLPRVVAAYSLRTLQGDTALELVLCTSIEAGNRAINSNREVERDLTTREPDPVGVVEVRAPRRCSASLPSSSKSSGATLTGSPKGFRRFGCPVNVRTRRPFSRSRLVMYLPV